MTRILVLDDDVEIAEVLREVLADAGHEVITSTSATELPEGRFGCVVTDLLSISVYTLDSARDWLLRLADRYPGAPVVVVTGHQQAQSDAARLGARKVLMKPFDVDRLAAEVLAAITF